MNAEKIIQILAKHNYISQDDVTQVAKLGKNEDPIAYLIDQEKINRNLIGQALAEESGLKYFDIATNTPTAQLISLIPESIAKKYLILPIEVDAKSVSLTSVNKENFAKVDSKLKVIFKGKKLNFFISLEDDIENLLFSFKKPLETRISKIIKSQTGIGPNIVAEIIEDAISYNSSDIHLEPLSEEVSLRFRIDGALREIVHIPKSYYDVVINRIKVLADLRIDEHSQPQDGAIRFTYDDRSFDLRISIVPTINGEKIVIRILSDYIKDLSLENLGLSDSNRSIVNKSTKKTFGMILAVGPTGSGKTTTLYSILNTLNKPDVNITTIEDPVEYKINGVNQIQVNTTTNVTFARGLRSIVRQDPNIILVGEIRDKETAEIAINAALTGHLLLSTFHANDAATAIPRLLDMGVEPFLVSSTLNVIIAQRLIRKLCLSCRYSTEESLSDLKKILPNPKKYFKDGSAELYKSKGCEKCGNSGFRGRTAIFELIYNTNEIQDAIMKNMDSESIWEIAQSQGAKSFFDDGMDKVKNGTTSLEELIRVAPVKFDNKQIYEDKQ